MAWKIPRQLVLAVVVVVSLTMGCATKGPLEELSGKGPIPELGPQEVVRIQMEAFRNNDADDRGIEIAFRFASPANKRLTGPLPRFAGMMRNELYQPMPADRGRHESRSAGGAVDSSFDDHLVLT